MTVARIHSGSRIPLFHSSARRAQTRLFLLSCLLLVISIRMTTAFLVSSSTRSRIGSIMKRKPETIVDKAACTASTTTSRLFETAASSDTNANKDTASASQQREQPVPLYRSQGIFSVEKPLNWTSNDVVSYIRGMLEREARERGAKPVKVGSRRNKSRILKVGHGGTLDPLASGVLVIGVGKGTKELQRYDNAAVNVMLDSGREACIRSLRPHC